MIEINAVVVTAYFFRSFSLVYCVLRIIRSYKLAICVVFLSSLSSFFPIHFFFSIEFSKSRRHTAKWKRASFQINTQSLFAPIFYRPFSVYIWLFQLAFSVLPRCWQRCSNERCARTELHTLNWGLSLLSLIIRIFICVHVFHWERFNAVHYFFFLSLETYLSLCVTRLLLFLFLFSSFHLLLDIMRNYVCSFSCCTYTFAPKMGSCVIGFNAFLPSYAEKNQPPG